VLYYNINIQCKENNKKMSLWLELDSSSIYLAPLSCKSFLFKIYYH